PPAAPAGLPTLAGLPRLSPARFRERSRSRPPRECRRPSDRGPSRAAAPAQPAAPASAPAAATPHTTRRERIRGASVGKVIALEGRIDLEAFDPKLFLRRACGAAGDEVRKLDAVHGLVLGHVELERRLSLRRGRRGRARRRSAAAALTGPATSEVAAAWWLSLPGDHQRQMR